MGLADPNPTPHPNQATYHIRLNKPLSDSALNNILMPSEPAVASDRCAP
jgi:hypothetical protein